MAWISVHESIDGPKLRNLYKQLGCSKFEATGILNFLWFWGLTNAERDGLILYAEKEDIERYLYGVGAGCVLDPKKIVDALFDSGWLDWSPRGICIHDWETWQAQWQKAKDARERDAARKRESRRNSKAAAQNEEKVDAAKDGHTDGPTDGEENSSKSVGKRHLRPKQRRQSLLSRRSHQRSQKLRSTRRPLTSSGTHTRRKPRRAMPSRSIRPASMRASPRRSC